MDESSVQNAAQNTAQNTQPDQSFVVRTDSDASTPKGKGFDFLNVDGGKNIAIPREMSDSESSATAEELMKRYRSGKRDSIVYADRTGEDDTANIKDKGAGLPDNSNGSAKAIAQGDAPVEPEEGAENDEDATEDDDHGGEDVGAVEDVDNEPLDKEALKAKIRQEIEEELQEEISNKEAARLRKYIDSVVAAKETEFSAEVQKQATLVEELQRENERLRAIADDKKLAKPLFDEAPEALMEKLFREDDPEYLRNFRDDYPDMAKAHVALTTKMLNEFVKSAAERQEALVRTQQRQQQQQQEQAKQTVEALKNLGIKPEIFNTPEFTSFESSPDGQKKDAEYAERFGYGSVEHARHMYDAFAAYKRKATIQNSQSGNRPQIAAQQKKNDSSRVSSNPAGSSKVDVSRMSSSERAEYEMAQYRSKRQSR